MDARDGDQNESSSRSTWVQKISGVFNNKSSSVSTPGENHSNSMQQKTESKSANIKVEAVTKTSALGSLCDFNQLDTSHTLHPVEDEQIVHHRDILQPELKILPSGYMIPGVAANCVPKKKSSIETITEKAISYTVEEKNSESGENSTGHEEDSQPKEEASGGDEEVAEEKKTDDSTSTSPLDNNNNNEQINCCPCALLDPSVKLMISNCPLMKGFCPIPFDEPKGPFQDFQCRPEDDLKSPPKTKESKKEVDPTPPEETNAFLPELKKVYPPMPKISCQISEPFKEDPPSSKEPEKHLTCGSNFIRLCAKSEFCPAPFDSPKENFNDFVCDPCSKLNMTPEEKAQCLGEQQVDLRPPPQKEKDKCQPPPFKCNIQAPPPPPVVKELPYCEDEIPEGDIIDEMPDCEDDLPPSVEDDLPYYVEELPQVDEGFVYCDEDVIYEDVEIPYQEESCGCGPPPPPPTRTCQVQKVKTVEQKPEECQRNLKCCESKLTCPPTEKQTTTTCDPKPAENVPKIPGAACDSCLYKWFSHILPECDLPETQQPQECKEPEPSNCCEPLKLSEDPCQCQGQGKMTECDQQLKMYRRKLLQMEKKLRSVQQKEQQQRQQSCEQQLKCYQMKLAQIQKTLQSVQLTQKELKKQTEQQKKDDNNTNNGGPSIPCQPAPQTLPPQCYGQPIPLTPYDPNCCQSRPLYGPPPSNNGPQFPFPPPRPPPPGGPYFGPLPPGQPMRPPPPGQFPPFRPPPPSCGPPNFSFSQPPPPLDNRTQVPLQGPFTNPPPSNCGPPPTITTEGCPPFARIPSNCCRPTDKPLTSKAVVPCVDELTFCRDRLTTLKKKIFGCQGLDPRNVPEENSPTNVEKCDEALKCCRGQVQIQDHKYRSHLHDGVCGGKVKEQKEEKVDGEVKAKEGEAEGKNLESSLISKFKTSCHASLDKSGTPRVSLYPAPPPEPYQPSIQVVQNEPPSQMPRVDYPSIQATQVPQSEDFLPRMDYPGQQQQVMMGQYQGGGYYPAQYYNGNCVPPQTYDYYSQYQMYPSPPASPSPYNPQSYPNYNYDYSQQSQQQSQQQQWSYTTQQENCVNNGQTRQAVQSAAQELPSFDEMRDKVNACWNKFDETPTTKFVCDMVEQIDECFKTTNPDFKCPPLDVAAKKKCPEALQKLSEEQRRDLIQTGRSQCDLTCFDLTYKDKQNMNDQIHNSMCKCAACTRARYGDLDDDEDDCCCCCDPSTCRECGAKLDENGRPIEEVSPHVEKESKVSSGRPVDGGHAGDKSKGREFEMKDGKPVYEGGMSLQRTVAYLWKISEAEREAVAKQWEFKPAEAPAETPEVDRNRKYEGEKSLKDTENYLWGKSEEVKEEKKK